jgi:hypothetical protein
MLISKETLFPSAKSNSLNLHEISWATNLFTFFRLALGSMSRLVRSGYRIGCLGKFLIWENLGKVWSSKFAADHQTLWVQALALALWRLRDDYCATRSYGPPVRTLSPEVYYTSEGTCGIPEIE